MSQDHFPAQTLAAEIYIRLRRSHDGARHSLSWPQQETGEHNYPRLELVRLTFPRPVYTQAHCDETAESIESVYVNRENVRGLKMVHEPKHLRFFQARFERL